MNWQQKTTSDIFHHILISEHQAVRDTLQILNWTVLHLIRQR